MQQYIFNIQSKGGAGKSMLTYLQALKHQDDQRVFFVDFDSSSRLSTQQLQFLQGKTPPRFAQMGLLDAKDKLDRQLLFENLLELSQKDYDEFYLDFGAPESDQLPALFDKDYTIGEFKTIQDELNAQFIFNIVIAGGSAYRVCTNYLQRITRLVNGVFPVNIYVNQNSFSGMAGLIDELRIYASLSENNISSLKLFGDFDVTADPHKRILRKISEGKGMETYAFVEKINIQREISKI